MLKLLAHVGLTTREACGHTVRNITGCPYAGVSSDGHELFYVTPYLVAYGRNMLRTADMEALGFEYMSFGRAEVAPVPAKF